MDCTATSEMDIRFISSLTQEDESALAAAVLKIVPALLEQFPIAYTLRVETTSGQVFQHAHRSLEAVRKDASDVPAKVRAGGIA